LIAKKQEELTKELQSYKLQAATDPSFNFLF